MKVWPFPYIIIATGNKNKLRQFADLFARDLHLDAKGLSDFSGLPEIVEDQDTFEGNARKKAETISNALQAPVISDDSGLVVPALDGEPGVYSARYAGPDANDERNNRKLLKKIRFVPEQHRQGIYVCAMALAVPGEETQLVRGECTGIIIEEPRGDEGFGYDPIFYLPSEQKTMAELPAERKYQISHRAKATEKLTALLKSKYIFTPQS
ncbi:XTP/dITP diphosphatase [Paenactinomyces guangxiensis]|uniref:dITP/XTP pyrophosphatase n=1 Tax=Paenactinomyces guangxiensis TaxID=1490290 RepID=A0A7W1WUG3_9BACL|nr:XTP/dITP diphosphatase [Paenactinomyces guangxiensis]MBA4496275.1 XTP/dITP diphosphatase [Paenactinomyces guangxiensis]MBH8593328.1 XTP/dITP diphosphatase [Paenactinomyces guangxiensis]